MGEEVFRREGRADPSQQGEQAGGDADAQRPRPSLRREGVPPCESVTRVPTANMRSVNPPMKTTCRRSTR
jgi:hypothetical protein